MYILPTMTTPTILRCKTCKATARVDVGSDFNGFAEAAAAAALLAASGGTPAFGAIRSLENLFCCGRRVTRVSVRGVFRPAHKCDARCLSSAGGKCECACGGRNHGMAYAVAA